MKETIAVYPGSFDPITNGHIDIIERSLKFIDRIVIAVTDNPHKKPLFELNKRISIIKNIFKKSTSVEVEIFNGLLVDYLKKKNIFLIIRGLREVSDFNYEFQIVLTNRKFLSRLETIFLMPREEYLFLSSSIIKEIASMNGDVKKFVPEIVAKELKNIYKNR
ncbi:MAG: pantetheine-phosphate adenylyltransferase [Candidatus Omnitrophica bacterium]|nr:pantetheine-phosphate adenylyltransferase [Candidatus Omnitrophota bacterium]